MLGPKQLEWLKREVIASKAAVKFICSGSEWQTQSGPDCWPSFARERREIFDHLVANGIDNVVLLSGDRHFTAAYQVEGRFIEVTSGPLGSPNSKITKPPPEMFSYHDHGKIYSVFEVDTTNTSPALTLEIYETGSGLLEKRCLTWEEVTGAVKIPPLRNADLQTSNAKRPASE
jgi:alkaline phosphatase D